MCKVQFGGLPLPHSKLQAKMSEQIKRQTKHVIIVIRHHCYHCYHTSFLSDIAKISRPFLTQHCQSFKNAGGFQMMWLRPLSPLIHDVASASHWRFALGFHLLIGASHYGESRLSSKTNMRCMVFTAVASVLGRYEAY